MLLSIKWLNDYIDLSDVSVEEIIEKLTASGLEVDEVTDLRKKYENIVVGYVEESRKHPNADKLSICKVNDGENNYTVICGAPNVATGQKVAFAKVGAVIPENGMKLQKVKLRGVLSEGMICSGKELEINDDHSGIMVLDENLSAGKPISEVFGLDDVILEVAITPNRADALSHIGVARDLAALFGKSVKYPEIKIEETDEKASDVASVEILNTDNCPRYSARIVKNVTIKESPEWLKERLTAVGLRPINNVVDVTNFVLYEVGQPLHAFDLNMLSGKKIIVKNAGVGERFTTLDSKQRTLDSRTLLICDAEKPVAIAGIMGGENSEVTEETKDILIESAFFNPSSIRRTSKVLGLSTDSSYRFERGTNPEITVWAATRAAQLIQELAGGEILKDAIDVYPNPIERRKIKLRFARLNKILGYEVEPQTVRDILERLELKIIEDGADYIVLEIPAFRHDLEREIDLIEEVARIYGYDKIPEINHVNVTLGKKEDETLRNEKIRDLFVGLGYREIITNSLLNEELAKRFGKPLSVLNPQSAEMTNPRTSLLPGMLQTISRNIKVKEKNLKLFEIGHIFNRKHEKIESFDDFRENESLLFAITGNKFEKEWFTNPQKFDFYDLKGDLEEFLTKFNETIKFGYEYKKNPRKLYDYGIVIKIGSKKIGFAGKLEDKLLAEFDIKQNVFVGEIDLNLLPEAEKKKSFKQILRFPKVYRDMAFVVDKTIDAEEVMKVIKKGSSELLKNIRLFDIFESDSLGKNKKSLAFELEYYDYSRTLTEEEVDKDFWSAIEQVKIELKAELRG